MVSGEHQRTCERHTDDLPQSDVSRLVRDPDRLPGIVEMVLFTMGEAEAGIGLDERGERGHITDTTRFLV
jgi:hypothetical protein